MIRLRRALCLPAVAALAFSAPSLPAQTPPPVPQVFGFRDFTRQARWDATFLAVPDPALARKHLEALASSPHGASSPEDYASALYVAARFREAGLATQIVPYRVLMNKPVSVLVEAFDADGARLTTGPTREHVEPIQGTAPDPWQDDPRILPAFNGASPSGDVTAEVVYANYGRLSDFQQLASLGISVRGRIVLVRYGGDFRGVKVYLAQQYGARGVLLYSDPADDGARAGTPYPAGPYRPDTAVQRGSVQFMPIYPGDPTTPGVASIPTLPESHRIPADKLQYDLPSIPVNPISSTEAAPILRALTGPAAPRDWQGGLPFDYHLGAGSAPVTVHMRLVQDTRLRTIWDVIGTIPGTAEPGAWVIAGNHRDAWVFGAADPGSGTAAMLEAVHGLGVLLKQGWRPRRTVVLASWDAEEEGLMGSTEWAEQHPAELARAAAYLNLDVAVSGPTFNASAVPGLREFLRQITREVPSPAGGTVYDRWKHDEDEGLTRQPAPVRNAALPDPAEDVQLGDLGSGSDYTPFLQHFGVPATDIGSDGPFGVYHTVYDNLAWFTRFADPGFLYTQQQARIFGLEILHLASADLLPCDFELYANEIRGYLDQARSAAVGRALPLDFTAALASSARLQSAASAIHRVQRAPPAGNAALDRIDRILTAADRALLLPAGLPHRPWYRHSIYAPGEFTGYAAVVLPGVNEAIDAGNPARAQAQLDALAAALDRAAAVLRTPYN